MRIEYRYCGRFCGKKGRFLSLEPILVGRAMAEAWRLAGTTLRIRHRSSRLRTGRFGRIRCSSDHKVRIRKVNGPELFSPGDKVGESGFF
jgi:hypothetical protein